MGLTAAEQLAKRQADDAEWARFRGQHVPLPGMTTCVARFEGTIPDDKGGIGAPSFRITDAISALHERGEISDEEVDAGRRFQHDFDLAHFETVGSVDWAKVSNPSNWNGPTLTDSICDARNRVWDHLKNLGGSHTPIALAAWWVLGFNLTIKEFASKEGWAGRPMNPQVAKGLVIGALAVLAGHNKKTCR
ncbi:MAG TPA: hypothetical protein DCW68_06895 [Rhodospirillaceae bacterium]|nr:MAG: hypothetical protein A2018_01405 [Alphaproteobacteria bacterium GWF2_58_20]HAU29815.1 hypothetical protein [Rhodospirillaceae bacterium]